MIRSQPALDRLLADVLAGRPDADRGALVEAVRSADPLMDGARLNAMVERAWQRAHGLGPIAELLIDPAVTEVMINGPGVVWIDRNGVVSATDLELSASDLALLIERVLDPLGLRVDRVSPMVDARLIDGSRVNVVVPPLAVEGPVITIRRFPHQVLPLDAFGPVEMIEMLRAMVEERRSIVVSGGTGSGKTSLLNAMGALLGETERIVVLEDTSELRFPGRHVVRLESRQANSEGVGRVTLRHLVRNALRMRPDRIVIGEVRGGEALDLVMALNTGHRGMLTTCHAGSAPAALDRLHTLALMGGVDVSSDVISRQLGSGVEVVVQVERIVGAAERRVIEIAEVVDASTVRTLWRSAPGERTPQ